MKRKNTSSRQAESSKRKGGQYLMFSVMCSNLARNLLSSLEGMVELGQSPLYCKILRD